MTDKHNQQPQSAAEEPEVEINEEELINELEGQRTFDRSYWVFWLIGITGFCWSAFQLYAAAVPINSTLVRSVHLAFALFMIFIIYPRSKQLAARREVPLYDFALAIAASLCALYIYLDFEGLAQRPGDYLQRDIIVGIVGTLLLLEAARRALGIALTIVACVFLVYTHFGPHMPDMIAHRGASVYKMVSHLYLTTGGIFGVPLGVSAGFVFLFVLFGGLLERAGAGAYFINLAYALLGKYRGGPAKAAVAASGMTGIISGSSTANTVTTGTFTIPLMKKVGFPAHKAAAVEVASSINGQLMPPIMGAAAFIIAEFLGLSFSDVIYAAFIPAFVSYFALFYIVHLEACKRGIKGEDPAGLPRFWSTFFAGIHYLIPVILLIYTLTVLRQSAVMAAFNAIVFIMLIMLVQRPIMARLSGQPLYKGIWSEGLVDIAIGMVNGAKGALPIAAATAVAGIVVGSVTLTGIGQVLVDVVETLSRGNILAVLLLTALVSLVLGMGLPTTANYIVVASLTAPIIMQLSQDSGYLIPALAAHLFVFYFGILADATPPVCLAAYAGAGIANASATQTGVQGFIYSMRTAILPFMFFFNPELLLISGVDSFNPADPDGWVWITNPLIVIKIFFFATLGMFAFSSLSQGYIIKRTNMLERVLLIPIIPCMFIPNMVAEWLSLPYNWMAYIGGLGIYAAVYFMQKMRADDPEIDTSW